EHLPGIRHHQPGGDAQQRRLAGAGGAQHHGELSAAQGEVRIVEGGGGADRAVGVTAVGVGDAHAVEAQRAGRAVRDGAVGVRGGGGGGHQFPPRASSGSTRVTRRVARTEPSSPITSTPATGSSTVTAEDSNGATVARAAPPPAPTRPPTAAPTASRIAACPTVSRRT